MIDEYLPNNGNPGYRVSRYELDLEYKVAINRLSGTATITAVTLRRAAAAHPGPVQRVDGVEGVGQRQARRPVLLSRGQVAHPAGVEARQPGRRCRSSCATAGHPRPIRSLWGDVGFEELTDGALVAGQPNGAASWFPCDDHPSAKAALPHPDQHRKPLPGGRQRQAGVAAGAGRADGVDLRATRADVDLPGHPADRRVRVARLAQDTGADPGGVARTAARRLRPRLRPPARR